MPADDTTAPVDAAEARDAEYRARGIDPATGLATDGEWPINHRLRAEAMAKAGVTSDPAGTVSDELIAETGERLEREAAAEEAATPSMAWLKDELVEAATAKGIAVEPEATKAAILDAIQSADADTQED